MKAALFFLLLCLSAAGLVWLFFSDHSFDLFAVAQVVGFYAACAGLTFGLLGFCVRKL